MTLRVFCYTIHWQLGQECSQGCIKVKDILRTLLQLLPAAVLSLDYSPTHGMSDSGSLRLSSPKSGRCPAVAWAGCADPPAAPSQCRVPTSCPQTTLAWVSTCALLPRSRPRKVIPVGQLHVFGSHPAQAISESPAAQGLSRR
jgi:hypothetical protein